MMSVQLKEMVSTPIAQPLKNAFARSRQGEFWFHQSDTREQLYNVESAHRLGQRLVSALHLCPATPVPLRWAASQRGC